VPAGSSGGLGVLDESWEIQHPGQQTSCELTNWRPHARVRNVTKQDSLSHISAVARASGQVAPWVVAGACQRPRGALYLVPADGRYIAAACTEQRRTVVTQGALERWTAALNTATVRSQVNGADDTISLSRKPIVKKGRVAGQIVRALIKRR